MTMRKVRRYAIYLLPQQEGEQARLLPRHQYFSAAAARIARSRLNKEGPPAGIHAGDEHPSLLPFGTTLYLEVGHKLGVPTTLTSNGAG